MDNPRTYEDAINYCIAMSGYLPRVCRNPRQLRPCREAQQWTWYTVGPLTESLIYSECDSAELNQVVSIFTAYEKQMPFMFLTGYPSGDDEWVWVDTYKVFGSREVNGRVPGCDRLGSEEKRDRPQK